MSKKVTLKQDLWQRFVNCSKHLPKDAIALQLQVQVGYITRLQNGTMFEIRSDIHARLELFVTKYESNKPKPILLRDGWNPDGKWKIRKKYATEAEGFERPKIWTRKQDTPTRCIVKQNSNYQRKPDLIAIE